MKSISEIDSNFSVKTKLDIEGLKFYNCLEAPFKLYGIFKEGDKFRRMPESVAKSVSEGVHFLHTNTAGGRVRFITDSPYVAIFAKVAKPAKMSHFALTGAASFDMYVDSDFAGTFIPPYDVVDSYEGIIHFPDRQSRAITINFPLYADVLDLYIGLSEEAEIKEPTPYKNSKPVVFYGSSITQGGCASRAGMSYEGIVSRRLNLDYINLGFSGNAKAEDEMIEYIKGLDMSIFVLDYDHNAPTAEHLKATHEKLFKAVREQHPDISVIMMTRPTYRLTPGEEVRRSIVEATYNNAKNSGDNNVYFLDGKALTALCKGEGNVDGTHPTDFGFVSMAKAVGDLIETL